MGLARLAESSVPVIPFSATSPFGQRHCSQQAADYAEQSEFTTTNLAWIYTCRCPVGKDGAFEHGDHESHVRSGSTGGTAARESCIVCRSSSVFDVRSAMAPAAELPRTFPFTCRRTPDQQLGFRRG